MKRSPASHGILRWSAMEAYVPLFFLFFLLGNTSIWVQFAGLGVVLAYVLYRIGKIAADEHPEDVIRFYLKVDSGILVAMWAFHLIELMPGGVSSSFTHREAIPLMVLYLVLRLVELWWVERRLSGTKLSGQKIIPLLLVAAVILAFWGIPLLYEAYLVLFVAFGFVASLPLFLVHHLPKLPQKNHGQASGIHLSNLAKMHSLTQGKPLHLSASMSTSIIVIIWVVVVAAAIFVFLMLRKRSKWTHEKDSHIRSVVRTKWEKGKGLNLIPTDNPIRRQYQAWLLKQHQLGVTIRTEETPREFLKRAVSIPDDAVDPSDLTLHYEKNRYGGSSPIDEKKQ